MLEETINRNNEQILELKASFGRREEETRAIVSEFQEEIKGLESREA